MLKAANSHSSSRIDELNGDKYPTHSERFGRVETEISPHPADQKNHAYPIDTSNKITTLKR